MTRQPGDCTGETWIKIDEAIPAHCQLNIAPSPLVVQMELMVQEWTASGLSLDDFARHRGIRKGTLHYWWRQLSKRERDRKEAALDSERRRIRREIAARDRKRRQEIESSIPAAVKHGLLPVQIVGHVKRGRGRPRKSVALNLPPTPKPVEERFVLQLRDGRRLDVPGTFSVPALRRLLRILESPTC